MDGYSGRLVFATRCGIIAATNTSIGWWTTGMRSTVCPLTIFMKKSNAILGSITSTGMTESRKWWNELDAKNDIGDCRSYESDIGKVLARMRNWLIHKCWVTAADAREWEAPTVPDGGVRLC